MSNIEKWVAVPDIADLGSSEGVVLHDFPGDAKTEAKRRASNNGRPCEVWRLTYEGTARIPEVVFHENVAVAEAAP